VRAEFHCHLQYLRGPAAARGVLARLFGGDAHESLAVSVDLVRNARDQWLTRVVDQRVSPTDAVSFELMSREKVTQAFAYDRLFEMAGFEIMPWSTSRPFPPTGTKAVSPSRPEGYPS
jgi:predicted nucleic acid-binding protein